MYMSTNVLPKGPKSHTQVTEAEATKGYTYLTLIGLCF